ncbi:DUF512 domain-containing protein [uncultured Clostridium sp.]|uniref:DUF512 domain-containing protein n=1 Tax=uncultured Clostridium sp. TaxID=59620 RepID=UPI002606185D|nr:DUF512 domain-containing protein [uncultured Clostridium sp.]
MKNLIKEVLPGSIAEEVGIEINDFLLSINDKEIDDIIDYRFLAADDEFTLQIEKSDGEIWDIEIEKEPGEELGLEFGGGIMDKAKSCTNKCIFCFIDQNPKGMRETIYFKDDDSRLSFLQGNFVTLTNMKEEDIERIIKYHISPINISVHTTNPELRREMLNNRFAGEVYSRMERLAEAGIQMHAQIVCVPDINSGEELKRTIKDLYKLYPYVNNVAVVPLGMTKHRENLKKLRRFTKEESIETINFIKEMQDKFYQEVNEPFIRLSDEFYVVAGIDVPEAEFYNGYSQIEDGVGSIRYFRNRIMEDLKELDLTKGGKYTSITGMLAYPEVKNVMNKITEKNPKITIDVRPIINNFFGETITVSGLITGRDIIEQLKGKIDTKYLIMPDNMFRRGYEPGSSDVPIMLDDTVIDDIEKALNIKVIPCDYSGDDLISLLNKYNEEE